MKKSQRNLVNLLANGGVLLAPIGRAQQKLTLIRKSYKGELERTLTKLVIFERLAKEGEARGFAQDNRNPFDSRTETSERRGVKMVSLGDDERRAPKK